MHSWVTGDLLDDQIAAERYTPDQVRNLKSLRELGAIPLARLLDLKGSNYGVLPPSDAYVSSEQGIGLVRGGDLDHGHIRAPGVFAPTSFATPRGKLRVDDVLILAKGACIDEKAGVGLVGVARAGELFNGTSYRARCAKVNAGYLAAFCMTDAFLLQKRREISNTGVSYNSETAIHSFLVITPCESAQRYISAHMTQAETLRTWSRLLLETARTLLDGLITGGASEDAVAAAAGKTHELIELAGSSRDAHPPRKRSDSVDVFRDTFHVARVDASSLGGNWLAQAHRPDIAEAVKVIQDRGAWQTVREVTGGQVAQGRTPTYAENGVPCLKTKQVRGIFVSKEGCEQVAQDFATANRRLAVASDDILMNRSGAGSIGRVGIYLEQDRPMTNEHLLRLRIERPNDPGFVCVYFDSWWGQRVLERGVTGATGQLNLAVEYLLDLPVPTPKPEAQSAIGDLVRRSDSCRVHADRLLKTAQMLVEALIERKVTEAELSAAHTDTQADDALLRRLTTRGFDSSEGEPLFGDIEQLRELVSEATDRVGP